MHPLSLLLTAYFFVSTNACSSHRQCEPFHVCTREGECIEVPKLGGNCTSTEECMQIDMWSDCVDQVCTCIGDTVYHGYECVNLKPKFGKSSDARVLFYVLVAVTSCLSIGLVTTRLVEWRRCRNSCESEEPALIPSQVPPFIDDSGFHNSITSLNQ